jgi:hypothetical protein
MSLHQTFELYHPSPSLFSFFASNQSTTLCLPLSQCPQCPSASPATTATRKSPRRSLASTAKSAPSTTYVQTVMYARDLRAAMNRDMTPDYLSSVAIWVERRLYLRSLHRNSRRKPKNLLQNPRDLLWSHRYLLRSPRDVRFPNRPPAATRSQL